MSWFKRAKGKAQENAGQRAVPTVKTPDGRPGLTPPTAPKKRGMTPEERAAAIAAYRLAMRRHFAAIAAFERERRLALDITSYRWIAMDVHGTCDVAKRNGGKVFSCDRPPPEGYVQEGQCNSPDWCRCSAKPIIAGFDE